MVKSCYIDSMLPGNRNIYERVFEMDPGPSLYSFPWWLDATCGPGGWDIYVKNTTNGEVVIPYCKTVIRGLKAVINPPLSQWISVIRSDPSDKISLHDFIFSLNDFAILDMSFRPEKYLLYPGDTIPVQFRYSYIISASIHKEHIKSGYNNALRTNLKLGEERLQTHESDDINTFINLCHATYQKRKMKSPIWVTTVLPEVFRALKFNQSGRIDLAYYNGKPIAGIMTGWDKQTCYYLAAGRTDDDAGASGHVLLLHNAIMEANQAGRSFDFEGSMQPGIASFFHSFGANPVAYWNIKKYKGAGKIWSLFQK